MKLLGEGLKAVRHTDVRDVGAVDVVALGTLSIVAGAEPVPFDLQFEEVKTEI